MRRDAPGTFNSQSWTGRERIEAAASSTALSFRPAAPPPPSSQPTPPTPVGSTSYLTLELSRLGTTIRTLRAQADPGDLATLQRLMLAAIRRIAGSDANPGDYELIVHHSDPITIVT